VLPVLHPRRCGGEVHTVTPRPFTLLFDSECPFCKLEVEWLQRRDRNGLLRAIDIAAPGFDAAAYGLTKERVHARLHGVDDGGKLVEGMAAIRAAWRAAGVGWGMAWTGWPVLRWICDLGYLVFARYRVPLGRLFGRRCDSGSCSVR